MIIKIENVAEITALFAGWEERLIDSCLQGHLGEAYATSTYTSACIVVDVFVFFAGEVDQEIVEYTRSYLPGFHILINQDGSWGAMIEQTYANYRIRERYAIKKEPNVFDDAYLQSCIEKLAEPYRLEYLNSKHFRRVMREKWSQDLCALFDDEQHYSDMGLGVVALYEDDIVAGASSYAYYDGGIEVEIDTREDHRRKGLALACAAKLILTCRERGWYASWDAQNKGSVALAEKLGYHFDYAYKVYEVNI